MFNNVTNCHYRGTLWGEKTCLFKVCVCQYALVQFVYILCVWCVCVLYFFFGEIVPVPPDYTRISKDCRFLGFTLKKIYISLKSEHIASLSRVYTSSHDCTEDMYSEE